MDQLYRGDIKPIVATEARIGGKIIVAICRIHAIRVYDAYTPLIREGNRDFLDAKICRCESGPWFSAGARQSGRAIGVGRPLRSRGERE